MPLRVEGAISEAPILSQTPHNDTAPWIRPAEEQVGLKRSVETIRERIKVIITAIIVTTLVAVVYVATATKTYEATANILISPIGGSDPVIAGLGLLRESAEPTRDVETASQIIRNIEVARRAGAQLNPPESAEALLAKVSAEPVASSNIISVIASATSPQRAQEIANTFARAAVDEQTAKMHAAIEARLPPLEALAAKEPEAAPGGEVSVAAQVAELQALNAGSDPTLQVQTKATVPTSPSSPRKTLSILAGILAGLILGVGGAFALQALDPRLRRESQLQRLYRLPILARVPRAPRHSTGRSIVFGKTPPPIGEAYRTLRATLTGGRRLKGQPDSRVVLITGSSSGEGKTTSAVNLATALARVNKRVILIEADVRRPSISKLLGIDGPGVGVISVLAGNTKLEDALIQPPTYEGGLEILLAETALVEGWPADLFSTRRAEALIAEAREIADFVVIDSPPINEVVDTLPLAVSADDVALTVKLGRSRIDKLHELGELLVESGIRPSGFIVIGTGGSGRSEYLKSAGPTPSRGARSSSKPSDRQKVPR